MVISSIKDKPNAEQEALRRYYDHDCVLARSLSSASRRQLGDLWGGDDYYLDYSHSFVATLDVCALGHSQENCTALVAHLHSPEGTAYSVPVRQLSPFVERDLVTIVSLDAYSLAPGRFSYNYVQRATSNAPRHFSNRIWSYIPRGSL